jgi:C-terminal processing protease CtpA/Prc
MGNALKLNYRNGSIGSGLLSRFNLIVDYRNQKLTLTPNKHIKEPFLYNMSGIEIETPKPGEPVYQISFIRKDSPADIAGLQAGDQVICVNGDPVSKYTLTELVNLFFERPGRKITIKYLRNKGEASISFLLKEIL